ncbi:retinol-binding protein pinta [Cephus cinctus]|uniref:Retinol-binding protein pinta n=1 Tax=Cephus cinctus TaxID=211228 RepID=A0AAJ7BHB6_CEPCN|nr:retinol-binding protein pinta [Cephus cinctus]
MSQPPVYVCKLSVEEKKFAAVNLNETDAVRELKIEEIRQWILRNKDLCARTDDFFILRFLRGCKFDVEKTKKKFCNYHELRARSPEWYSYRDPFLPELLELFDLGVFLPLRKVDSEGRMVILIRVAVHDPIKHKQANVFKAGKMILDVAIKQNEMVSLHGVKVVFDLNGVTLNHALQMPPSVVKRLVHSWQGCYPMRIQSMDFVNAPIYVNVVLNVFKQFMSHKLRKRIHIHNQGIKAIHKIVPTNILPIEYGGTDGTLQDLKEYWTHVVQDNQDWFAEDEKYKMIL